MNGCPYEQLKVIYYICRPDSDKALIRLTADQAKKCLPCGKDEEPIVDVTTQL